MKYLLSLCFFFAGLTLSYAHETPETLPAILEKAIETQDQKTMMKYLYIPHNQTERYRPVVAKNMARVSARYKKHGGLKTVNVIETINKSATKKIVRYQLNFRDGSKSKSNMPVEKHNGLWKATLN